MTTLLRRAAERHTKSPCGGTGARDARGYKVGPKSKKAVSWCPAGAIIKESVTGENAARAIMMARAAAQSFGFSSLYIVGDEHPDLMPDILSEAIELDEAQPLTGQALIDARAYEARRLEMIARGEQ